MSTASGKKGSKKDGVGGGWVCAHCKKSGKIGTMKRCGRCRLACYCSVECQKLHWKGGGHKKVCGTEGGSGTSCSSDGAGASAPLKHPCPICLDSEDDAGDRPGMCRRCGQMTCAPCSRTLIARDMMNCPTCRAPLRMCGKEMFEALQQLLSRSDDGRVIQGAQFTLGACYQDGNGVAKDEAEAVRLFRLAADQGHAGAQINLGGCYRDGSGVVQDDADSARWYRVAADQGHATAQYYVGVDYLYGTGVVRDIAEGIRWLRLSAGQGCVKAQDLSATLQACFDPH